MNNKYEIIKSGEDEGRIRALRSFGDVKKDDIGGFIESETNLSHNGDCWVFDDAKVYGNAKVFDDAKVSGNAKVFDDAKVYGNAKVFDNARVDVDAKLSGDAEVSGKEDIIYEQEKKKLLYMNNLNRLKKEHRKRLDEEWSGPW